MRIKYSHLRSISRRFWGTLFGSIIALAVLIQIGRQAFPLVNDYRHLIVESLSEQLDVQFEIGEMSAEWQGLRPKVMLNDVYVKSLGDEEIFYVETALLELSLIDSFIQGGPAWRTITFRRLRTTFEQKENFSWRLKGYDGGTANTDNPFLFDDPLDVFLFGRRVQIESASLNFHFFSGKKTELSIPSINLENDRFFHRMTASLNIEGNDALTFVIEGYGDPRDRAQFSASGYLGLKNIPTTDIYNAVFNKENVELEGLDTSTLDQVTNLDFWFKGSPQTGMTVSGALTVSGLPKSLETYFDLPESLMTNISGSWKADSGWALNLQDIDVEWGEKKLPLDSLSFYGAGRNVGLRIAELDVTTLVEIAIAANQSDTSRASEIVKTLKPEGVLRNIDVSLRSKQEGYFLAKMYLEDGVSQAFKGSPNLRNIDGYIETSLSQGYIDVDIPDGFSIGLTKVFDSAFALEDVKGQLSWRIDLANKWAYLKSSNVYAVQNGSEINSAFSMNLPFNRSIGEQEMTLRINVDNAEVSSYKDYLPKNVPNSLKEWLSSAVDGGQASDINVFFKGAVNKSRKVKPIYQIAAQIQDVTLKYNPNWPELSDVSGRFLLDSNAFFATLDTARVGDARVANALVSLGKAENGVLPNMTIAADISGPTRAAQAFLIDSPISENFTTFLSGWAFQGGFESKLDLSFPVEFNEEKLDYKIRTTLHNNSADMLGLGLLFKDVTGDFTYSKNGLAESDNLSLSLWGRDIKADINSNSETGDISVGFDARVDVDALKSWLARPELFALNHDFDATGEIVIPTLPASELDAPEITLRSKLSKVALDLPAPLGKKMGDSGDYELKVSFGDTGIGYRYNHNHLAYVDIQMSQTLAPAVSVNIGDKTEGDILFPGQVVVSGKLEQADFDGWFTAYKKYIEESEAILSESFDGGEGPDDDSTIVTTARLHVDAFTFGELLFPGLDVSISGDQDRWVFAADSERVKGSVTIPAADAPLKLEFDTLALYPVDFDPLAPIAEPVEGEPIVSALADVDLSGLVSMDVNIKNLSLLDDKWGQWQFLLEPIEGGIHLNDLNAKFKELHIGKHDPAQFYWTNSGGQNVSHFNGQIHVADVADALEAWEQEAIVTSKSAVFDVRAQWLAEPDLVSLANLYGDIELNLKQGSFVRATAAGENPLLRLIALFNFDTLARRVRLDFSDLAAKGFAYDQVSGKVNFAKGIATLSEPLIVESSSSRMQMAGTVDLVKEEVDAELVVTLPVAGNLAVATAFLVSVPAGLGVYIVSKMLGKAVDKASSINYSIEGPWEDPRLKVRKIFDDEAAVRKGEKLKREKSDRALDSSSTK